jgi:hypothetical protein
VYVIDVTDGPNGPSISQQSVGDCDEGTAVAKWQKMVDTLSVPAGCEYWVYLFQRSEKGEQQIRVTRRSQQLR